MMRYSIAVLAAAALLAAPAGARTTATTLEVRQSLEGLATRYRALAAARAEQQPATAADNGIVRHPGDPALHAGVYHQLNIFGTPTGATFEATRGQPLPDAPRNHTWRLAET